MTWAIFIIRGKLLSPQGSRGTTPQNTKQLTLGDCRALGSCSVQRGASSASSFVHAVVWSFAMAFAIAQDDILIFFSFYILITFLQLWKDYSLLGLVLAFAVGVAGFADFVGLEEDDLAEAFVGVDACGKWRGVGDL